MRNVEDRETPQRFKGAKAYGYPMPLKSEVRFLAVSDVGSGLDRELAANRTVAGSSKHSLPL